MGQHEKLRKAGLLSKTGGNDMKASHAPRDTDNPNEIMAKLQSKLDRARSEATRARAILFDLEHPDYETDDIEFKQQYIYFKEEMKSAIQARDQFKRTVQEQTKEINRLREIIKHITKEA